MTRCRGLTSTSFVVAVAFLGGALGLAQQPRVLPAERNDVWSVALSKDGKMIAAGAGWWDAPGEVGIWELESRKPLKRFAENRGVPSVTFSTDGKWIAYGSWTGHIKVVDWAANKEIADFMDLGVTRVAFSPDGKLLASAAERKQVKLWDLTKKQLLADLEGDLIRFVCVRFSPDGKQILAGGGEFKPGEVNHVTIWDVETKQQIGKLDGHEMAVVTITYSPDGAVIATGAADRTIRFWDAKTFMPLKTLKGHGHWIEALVFTPDGKTLISSSHDHTVRFWDVETGMEKDVALQMPGSVRSLALTPDGKSLLVGGGPKLLKILDLPTKAELATLWHNVPQQQAAFVNDLIIRQPIAIDALPVAEPERPESRAMWLLAGLAVGVVLIFLLILIVMAKILLTQRQGRKDVKAELATASQRRAPTP